MTDSRRAGHPADDAIRTPSRAVHIAIPLVARDVDPRLGPCAGCEGERLVCTPLDPPLHEVFAFIHRRNARLSPATRALMTLAEHRLAELAHRPGG